MFWLRTLTNRCFAHREENKETYIQIIVRKASGKKTHWNCMFYCVSLKHGWKSRMLWIDRLLPCQWQFSTYALFWGKMNKPFVDLTYSHTVDGRDPANQLIGSLPHYSQGFHTSQVVVWDFFHNSTSRFFHRIVVFQGFRCTSHQPLAPVFKTYIEHDMTRAFDFFKVETHKVFVVHSLLRSLHS